MILFADEEDIFNSKESIIGGTSEEPNYQGALDALGLFARIAVYCILRSSIFSSVCSILGYGKFHVLLLLVCGLANASDAVEILCVSLLLPSVQCDLNIDTSAKKGWLAAIIFIGTNYNFRLTVIYADDLFLN